MAFESTALGELTSSKVLHEAPQALPLINLGRFQGKIKTHLDDWNSILRKSRAVFVCRGYGSEVNTDNRKFSHCLQPHGILKKEYIKTKAGIKR